MEKETSQWRRGAALTGAAVAATITIGIGGFLSAAPMDYYFGVLLGVLVTSLAWWIRR